MAAIILVHGIDNQQLTPDGVEAEWLPALAGGIRRVGRPDLADRLWPPGYLDDAIKCRSAYYGDLFRTADQQGGAADIRELAPEQATFAEGLALEWLQRIAERAEASSVDRPRLGSRSTSPGTWNRSKSKASGTSSDRSSRRSPAIPGSPGEAWPSPSDSSSLH